jgi:hypothetical protein
MLDSGVTVYQSADMQQVTADTVLTDPINLMIRNGGRHS